MYCSFCEKNGELPEYYLSHSLKDENNNITCPILKVYTCPYCKEVGQHTLKYCPTKQTDEKESGICKKANNNGNGLSNSKSSTKFRINAAPQAQANKQYVKISLGNKPDRSKARHFTVSKQQRNLAANDSRAHQHTNEKNLSNNQSTGHDDSIDQREFDELIERIANIARQLIRVELNFCKIERLMSSYQMPSAHQRPITTTNSKPISYPPPSLSYLPSDSVIMNNYHIF